MFNKWGYIALVGILLGCGDPEPEEREIPMDWDTKKSSEFNKGLSQKEADDIRLYLEMRPDWNMVETGSGLRIWIYEKGEGLTPEPEDIAQIEYEISLLTGEIAYETEDDEYEEIRVDHSDIETGIQEALKLMRVGDEAKLIVPSHLGHGLLGDLDKIPPLRSLVIDLKLIGIKNK